MLRKVFWLVHDLLDTITACMDRVSQGCFRFMIHAYSDAGKCTRVSAWGTQRAACFLVSSLLITAQLLWIEEGFCRSLPTIDIYSNTTIVSTLLIFQASSISSGLSYYIFPPCRHSTQHKIWQIVWLVPCYIAVALRKDPSKEKLCANLEQLVRGSEDRPRNALMYSRFYARQQTPEKHVYTHLFAGRTIVRMSLFEARRRSILPQERQGTRLSELLLGLLDLDHQT